jgi:Na+/pantothenate symporter
VAIAASVGNDLLPAGTGVWTQRGVLATLAAITIAIAWSPPSLVLVLGQAGVYGLVAASAGPLVVGLMREGPLPASVALASALVALAVHLGIYLGGLVVNPGLSASAALLVGVAISWFGTEMVRNPAAESPQMS